MTLPRPKATQTPKPTKGNMLVPEHKLHKINVQIAANEAFPFALSSFEILATKLSMFCPRMLAFMLARLQSPAVSAFVPAGFFMVLFTGGRTWFAFPTLPTAAPAGFFEEGFEEGADPAALAEGRFNIIGATRGCNHDESSVMYTA